MSDPKPSSEAKGVMLNKKVLRDSSVMPGTSRNDWYGGVMWVGETKMEHVTTLERATEVLHMYETCGSTKPRDIEMIEQWKEYVAALAEKAKGE
jgi:hypothetical protein